MNKYFLIKKTSDNIYAIINGPDYLPQTFGSTSGFNNLETNAPELLPDLTWQDNSDLGFWLAVFDKKPSCNIDQKLIENHTVEPSTKTCKVSYAIQDIESSEVNIRTTQLKQNIRMMRDRYLVITDFTQLSDSPISDAAKLDFKNFRQQLRTMLDIPDVTQAVWPTIPTSAPNISIPPFPPMPSFNG
jgi:hypothetical protein